jgi:hypothetical protein
MAFDTSFAVKEPLNSWGHIRIRFGIIVTPEVLDIIQAKLGE